MLFVAAVSQMTDTDTSAVRICGSNSSHRDNSLEQALAGPSLPNCDGVPPVSPSKLDRDRYHRDMGSGIRLRFGVSLPYADAVAME